MMWRQREKKIFFVFKFLDHIALKVDTLHIDPSISILTSALIPVFIIERNCHIVCLNCSFPIFSFHKIQVREQTDDDRGNVVCVRSTTIYHLKSCTFYKNSLILICKLQIYYWLPLVTLWGRRDYTEHFTLIYIKISLLIKLIID